jgi:hypothetical protein
MADISLQFTTGDEPTDALLLDIVAVYEGTFPANVVSYYLFGSYADGSAVAASDIDLILVFRGDQPDAATVQRVREVAAAWSRQRGPHLDTLPLGEGPLRRDGHFRVKHGSVLLHGDDLRADLPDIPLAAYLRDYARAPLGYAVEGFRHADRLAFPLTYPDPDDEFRGYVLANREPVKAFVSAACWDASLLVTLITGRTVASKGESVRLYRECIGGAWADFVTTLYAHDKRRWSYAVPTAPDERQLLRRLCRDYLALENHYFGHYRRYLLAELASDDRARVGVAVQRCGVILYPDLEIAVALTALCVDSDAELRSLSRDALERIQYGRLA